MHLAALVDSPTDLTFALAKGARMRGARICEKTRVLDVLTIAGRVSGVRTDAGDTAYADVVPGRDWAAGTRLHTRSSDLETVLRDALAVWSAADDIMRRVDRLDRIGVLKTRE